MENTAAAPENKTSWFRGFIRGKTRVVFAWVFSGVLVLSARDFPIWPGVFICLIGASLRYWASGFLRKDTKPAVGGPYAWTRNPLYLGTYLMAIGTAVAIQNWWLVAMVTVCFAAVYHYIILDEEEKLDRLFGASYESYCQTVPRFFPTRFPNTSQLQEVNPNPLHHRFDAKLARKNKAHEAYLAFAGLVAFVTLIAFVWQRFFLA